MHYKIVVGKSLSALEEKAIKKTIKDTFREIDQIYNKWNHSSELSKLNRTKAHEKVTLSPQLNTFLEKTGKYVQLTQGKFDPTIEPLQNLWKTHLEKKSTPSKAEVANVIPAIGWHNIHIEEGLLWKDHDQTALDLGGIAKGFAIDELVERLNAQGFLNLYVEWGGEIRTSGRHPDNRPWSIFISKMGNMHPDSALAIVDTENASIASSGDYLQNWTVDGVTYFHIIDPNEKCPMIAGNDSICSATIITDKCMEADIIATTAMLFKKPKEANEWLKSIENHLPNLRYFVSSRAE